MEKAKKFTEDNIIPYIFIVAKKLEELLKMILTILQDLIIWPFRKLKNLVLIPL
jgi:hypothetical protein